MCHILHVIANVGFRIQSYTGSVVQAHENGLSKKLTTEQHKKVSNRMNSHKVKIYALSSVILHVNTVVMTTVCALSIGKTKTMKNSSDGTLKYTSTRKWKP